MNERVEVPVNLTEVPLAARTVIGAKVSGVIDIGRMEKEEPVSDGLVYCESSDVDMCNLLGTLLL